MPTNEAHVVLRMTSPDRPGILAAVSSVLAADGWDIREAAVYGAPDTRVFFVRMELSGMRDALERLPGLLDPLRQSLGLSWDARDKADPVKLLVAVSRTDQRLNDIIHKSRIGTLPVTIVGIVSNHESLRAVSEWHGHSFHHLPVTSETRSAQEQALSDLIAGTGAELLVLARYMQFLSDGFASSLAGRCISIHHSFLPSFKGARPYHQAQARGVKLIGATAHYVTADLDEGPIVEQDIRRVTCSATAAEMVEIGRETEASVLSRAIRWHAEGRVFLNGNRTVVFA